MQSRVLSLVQDTFFRYLKSPVYKDMQKKALNPEPHNFRLVVDPCRTFLTSLHNTFSLPARQKDTFGQVPLAVVINAKSLLRLCSHLVSFLTRKSLLGCFCSEKRRSWPCFYSKKQPRASFVAMTATATVS